MLQNSVILNCDKDHVQYFFWIEYIFVVLEITIRPLLAFFEIGHDHELQEPLIASKS